jgi:hypothetical protein
MFLAGDKVRYIGQIGFHKLTRNKIYIVVDQAIYNKQNGTNYKSTSWTFAYGDDGILNGWTTSSFELAKDIEPTTISIDWFELNRSVI